MFHIEVVIRLVMFWLILMGGKFSAAMMRTQFCLGV
jgi:hypothetical protein